MSHAALSSDDITTLTNLPPTASFHFYAHRNTKIDLLKEAIESCFTSSLAGVTNGQVVPENTHISLSDQSSDDVRADLGHFQVDAWVGFFSTPTSRNDAAEEIRTILKRSTLDSLHPRLLKNYSS
jgi:hypothetical protein